MKEQITFADLSEWARAEVARHLAQTYGMQYGSRERQEALTFRLPFDDVQVVRTEAPAVLLRELRDAAAAGGTVKAPRLSPVDSVRVSNLLLQTASRAEREARDVRDRPVTDCLDRLWRTWDAAHKVPQDQYERAELARMRSV